MRYWLACCLFVCLQLSQARFLNEVNYCYQASSETWQRCGPVYDPSWQMPTSLSVASGAVMNIDLTSSDEAIHARCRYRREVQTDLNKTGFILLEQSCHHTDFSHFCVTACAIMLTDNTQDNLIAPYLNIMVDAND